MRNIDTRAPRYVTGAARLHRPRLPIPILPTIQLLTQLPVIRLQQPPPDLSHKAIPGRLSRHPAARRHRAPWGIRRPECNPTPTIVTGWRSEEDTDSAQGCCALNRPAVPMYRFSDVHGYDRSSRQTNSRRITQRRYSAGVTAGCRCVLVRSRPSLFLLKP